MSIPNMIGALMNDNKLEAESAFKDVISHKVGSALDLKRVQVANSGSTACFYRRCCIAFG